MNAADAPPDEALRIVPVTFKQACEYVTEHHRHHGKPAGMKFCIGAAVGAELVGVAIVGRPSARAWDNGHTLEVIRTATDGTENANSMLYGASWRACQALGFDRLVTYTQEGESGASLRGAGWRVIGTRKPRAGWNAPSRPRTSRGVDSVGRTVWEKTK